MTIGDLSGVSPSNAMQVALVRGQQDQKKTVISTLLQGASSTAPSAVTGKGGRVNVIA